MSVWREAVSLCGSTRAAVKKFPELHGAYILEANLPQIREAERRAAAIARRCANLSR